MVNIQVGYKEIMNTLKTCLASDKIVALALVVGIFICWFLPNSKEMEEHFKPTILTGLFAEILIILCIFNFKGSILV